MDPEDIFEVAELGVLFGGFEIIESLLAALAVLVVIAVLVAGIFLLDFDVATIFVVLALMAGSALAGGLAGMKVERLRRKHF
ncbi:MAG: hypothetical protein ACI8XM_000584 [Haloarculaceae archaeon]|jgi:hypothetical protein